MAGTADYYTGFTQAETEAIFAAHKLELATVIQQYSESGTLVIKRRMDEINATIAACQAALKRFDPATYGATRRVSTSRVCGVMPR